MTNTRLLELRDRLLATPESFVHAGGADELLRECYRPPAIDLLRSLLQVRDPWVEWVATYVASELGELAAALGPDVARLLDSENHHTQYHAIEISSWSTEPAVFSRVLEKLESSHKGIRFLTLKLLRSATPGQVALARAYVAPNDTSTHALGIKLLLAPVYSAPTVSAALRAEDPLLQRYAALTAARWGKCAVALAEVLPDDEDMVEFLHDTLAKQV